MVSRIKFGVLVLAGVMAFGQIAPVSAYQDGVDLTDMVRSAPSDNTPTVPGTWDQGTDSDEYEVSAFAAYNGVMYAGGKFDTVVSSNGLTQYTNFKNIFSFNPTTGQVNTTFAPQMGGQVEALLAYDSAIYAVGSFTTVGGQSAGRIVKLNPTNGQIVSAFNVSADKKISDIDVAKGYIVVTGKFTSLTYNGTTYPRAGIAFLDKTTGEPKAYGDGLTMTGSLQGNLDQPGSETPPCETGGYRMAVSPAGTKLVVSGCFTKVSNYSRQQIALVNLGTTDATLADWRSPELMGNVCQNGMNPAAVEDVDFQPTGRYFYLAIGGGPHGKSSLCDSLVKFDSNATGSQVASEWHATTSGDTLRSVEASSTTTFTAGHNDELYEKNGNTWTAFSRDGIGAVSNSGSIRGWNPGHGREIGSRELYFTNSSIHAGFPTGLWVGSDSGNCGKDVGYTRDTQGICFFPMLQP